MYRLTALIYTYLFACLMTGLIIKASMCFFLSEEQCTQDKKKMALYIYLHILCDERSWADVDHLWLAGEVMALMAVSLIAWQCEVHNCVTSIIIPLMHCHFT